MRVLRVIIIIIITIIITIIIVVVSRVLITKNRAVSGIFCCRLTWNSLFTRRISKTLTSCDATSSFMNPFNELKEQRERTSGERSSMTTVLCSFPSKITTRFTDRISAQKTKKWNEERQVYLLTFICFFLDNSRVLFGLMVSLIRIVFKKCLHWRELQRVNWARVLSSWEEYQEWSDTWFLSLEGKNLVLVAHVDVSMILQWFR